MSLQSRLILVDGLPGSGKSTLAEQLAHHLQRDISSVNYLYETAEGHPLHPLPVDSMGAAWADIHTYMQPEAFARGSLDRWRQFVDQLKGTFVVESFPFQSTVRVLLQMGADSSIVDDWWKEWSLIVKDLHPTVIYLREADPEGLIRVTCDRRGSEWTTYFLSSVASMELPRRMGWCGLEAAVKFLEVYSKEIDRLICTGFCPVLEFESRPIDYDARLQTVVGTLAL